MVELLRLGIPESVLTVNLAGEPLSTELVNRIYRETKAERVYDLYGPSEDTTYSTFTLRLPEAPASIGRPIAGTQVYVLDGNRQLVPFGVPGELYLGGWGLARGYLDRPELTAERFIPNPFPGAPSPRLYQTGDLVRYQPDGDLVFLGRLDHQVKVRGFRIELGEVEGRLRRHPAVQDVVVISGKDMPGESRLVAYVVGKASESVQAAELRAYLKQALPAFMVPAAFVILDRLPMTPNGKVDRKALPAPERIPTAPGDGYKGPRNDLERRIAEIWAETLGVERVSVEDDFFELGGHSLLVVSLSSRLGQALVRPVPMNLVFQAPTVAMMAERQAAHNDSQTLLTNDEETPARPKWPLFCLSTGSSLAKALGDRPAYSLALTSQESAEFRTIEDYVSCMMAKLRNIQPEGKLILVAYSAMGCVALEMAQQLLADGREVPLLVLFEPSPLTLAETRGGGVNRIRLSAKRGYYAGAIRRMVANRDLAVPFRFAQRRLKTLAEAIRHSTPFFRGSRGIEEYRRVRLASSSYVAKPYPGRVLIFSTAFTQLKFGQEMYFEGWKRVVQGEFTLIEGPGDHASMLAQENAEISAPILEKYLSRLEQDRYDSDDSRCP